METVVVDNQSTDGTVEIAEKCGAKVLHAGPERCAQRNAGIWAANGTFVFVADSDMVFEPDVIPECLRAISGAQGVAVPEISYGTGFWSACKAFERSFYQTDATVSAARFFRTADLLRIGGYDENLLGGEDWDVSMRVVGNGSLAFTQACIRHDEGRITLAQAFIKKRYYGAGVRRFLEKHGRKGWKRVSPARAGIFRQAPRLLRHPFLASGMLMLKIVEAAGILTGMAGAQNTRDLDRVYKPQ